MATVVKARVTSKGQVTVPKAIRQQLRIRPGDELMFEVRGARVQVVARHRQSVADVARLFPAKRARPAAEERRQAWVQETRRLVRGRRAAR